MKIVGIILEANPYHLGHKYFINKIKSDYNPDILIAITSTSFSMRGDVSLLDKFNKTSILLNEGIDIVLELPFSLAVQSADFFAENSVKILNCFGITELLFGSEIENIELYNKCYSAIFKKMNDFYFPKDLSKKEAFNLFLRENDFSNEEIQIIESPNFTLGLQYIKCIKDNKLNINYNLIKRINNNYHDKIPTNNIASATSIRNLFLKGEPIDNYINYSKELFPSLKNVYFNLNNIANYVYNINDLQNNSDFMNVEGIHNYIKNNGIFNTNYISLIESLKNKKYTSSTISRSILHKILNTTKNQYSYCNYLRLLGANSKGFNYIGILNKDIKNYIFSNPNEVKNKAQFKEIVPILDIELNATKLYSLITENNELFLKEYKLPIRKD